MPQSWYKLDLEKLPEVNLAGKKATAFVKSCEKKQTPLISSATNSFCTNKNCFFRSGHNQNSKDILNIIGNTSHLEKDYIDSRNPPKKKVIQKAKSYLPSTSKSIKFDENKDIKIISGKYPNSGNIPTQSEEPPLNDTGLKNHDSKRNIFIQDIQESSDGNVYLSIKNNNSKMTSMKKTNANSYGSIKNIRMIDYNTDNNSASCSRQHLLPLRPNNEICKNVISSGHNNLNNCSANVAEKNMTYFPNTYQTNRSSQFVSNNNTDNINNICYNYTNDGNNLINQQRQFLPQVTYKDVKIVHNQNHTNYATINGSSNPKNEEKPFVQSINQFNSDYQKGNGLCKCTKNDKKLINKNINIESSLPKDTTINMPTMNTLSNLNTKENLFVKQDYRSKPLLNESPSLGRKSVKSFCEHIKTENIRPRNINENIHSSLKNSNNNICYNYNNYGNNLINQHLYQHCLPQQTYKDVKIVPNQYHTNCATINASSNPNNEEKPFIQSINQFNSDNKKGNRQCKCTKKLINKNIQLSLPKDTTINMPTMNSLSNLNTEENFFVKQDYRSKPLLNESPLFGRKSMKACCEHIKTEKIRPRNIKLNHENNERSIRISLTLKKNEEHQDKRFVQMTAAPQFKITFDSNVPGESKIFETRNGVLQETTQQYSNRSYHKVMPADSNAQDEAPTTTVIHIETFANESAKKNNKITAPSTPINPSKKTINNEEDMRKELPSFSKEFHKKCEDHPQTCQHKRGGTQRNIKTDLPNNCSCM